MRIKHFIAGKSIAGSSYFQTVNPGARWNYNGFLGPKNASVSLAPRHIPCWGV
jgi:hypothetical protein